MSAYIIRPLEKKYFNAWVEMGYQLWPDYKHTEIQRYFRESLKNPKQKNFICFAKNNEPVGFANASLRVDYVEGSDSSPVGYLEGIFVEKKYRRRGIANMLFKEVEKWAKQKGAKEVGSDTWLNRHSSRKLHKALGFKEAEKLVHFIKKI